jgi:hypothetical protein
VLAGWAAGCMLVVVGACRLVEWCQLGGCLVVCALDGGLCSGKFVVCARWFGGVCKLGGSAPVAGVQALGIGCGVNEGTGREQHVVRQMMIKLSHMRVRHPGHERSIRQQAAGCVQAWQACMSGVSRGEILDHTLEALSDACSGDIYVITLLEELVHLQLLTGLILLHL